MGSNAAQQIKSEFFISDSFSISGKATDSYGIDAESLILTQVKGSGDDVVTIEIPITTINDKGEWTVGNLPRNTQAGSTDQSSVVTDDYTFTVSVTDLTGVKKETSAAYKVSIDLEAPVVTITSPSANEIVSGDTTRITGTLNDGNGTGISGYSYKFVKAGETAANVAWTSVTTKAENFSFYKDLVSGNTLAANSTALCEGSWSLHLKAVDEAGNESDEVVQNFKVDMNDPALTSAITTNSSCILQSGLYYFKGNLSGTTSATDTNEPERIVIEFKLGSEVIQPTINNGTWTIPASSFTADTPTTLTITAYDAVGNQTKKEYQVYYDVTAPSVNVAASALQNGAVVNSFPLTIYGTADDGTGIGATSIYYSLDGSEPVTELVAASSSWTKEITGTGLTEGSKALKLKIKDSLNNESAVTTINFSYDRSDPTLTETGIGESGATVNAGITLQGTTGDTNGIDSIEITDSANEDSRWTIARSEMTESGSSLTWSKSIELGTETNTLEDGRHNFTIIAKDLAGKQTKLTRSVVVDTTAPEILTITSPATDDEATGTNSISNATYKFIGTAQDSGSGIASYSYSFTHSSTAPATGWTTVNAGNGEWEITKTLTAASETNCLEQGEWYLFVKATDKAGNTVAAPVSRHFWIDMGAPSVTDVNIAGGTYYFSTDALTITGKSIDTHGLKQTGAVVIKKTAEGETAADETLASINASAVGTNGAWSAAIAADAIPSDGTPVTITIEATDIVGRTSGVNTYTVCKDMVAPVSNAAMAYQNGVNIQFTGTASDTNLDEVKAELYKNNETTPASTTTLSPDRTTGAWTWKVYDLDQASYKLKVIAKDKAGNTSDYTTGSITIDTTAPKTTVNGTALYKADGTAADSSLSDGTVEEIEKKYAQSSYTLSGTITDANFESIVLKENGTTKTVTVEGANWTYTPAAFTTGTEVTNNYTITVKDKANNITSYSLTVVYDTKAPVIEITSPEATYYPTVPDANGTVRDSGIGIAEVKYSTDGNTWSDTGWTSGMNWSVDIATMITEEGPVTLYLKAKDKFGNESTPPVSVSFSYDSAAPSIEETDSISGPTGNNTSFTITGKAWDSNGLSRIEIVDNDTTYAYKISGTTDTTPLNDSWITGSFISLTAAQSSPANNNWSATFVVGNSNSTAANYFADGTHQLVIKVYDVAGRASTAIYKSVFVDLNDPVVEITTPSAVASTNQTTYLFRGTIQEANLDKATLWVYRVKQGTETEDVLIGETAGHTLAPSYNSGAQKYDWSYTGFDFENDKEYYVKVTAFDLAGRTHTVTSNGVSVDNQAPTTTLTGSGLYASGASGLTLVTSLTNQETYYANSAYTLGGTVTENKAMGSVQVKVDNNATDTLTLSSNAWTKTGVTTDGNHKYAITVKDAAGNSSMYSINVVYDATNPEVLSATVPTTSYTEGVSYKFTGTAQDSGSGLKKIEVQIVNNGANPSESGWTEALGLTSWNSTIVFSEYNVFSTEGIKTLCVRATDEVGNVSTVFTKNFVYDKAYPTLAVSTYTPEDGSALTISSTDNEPIFNVNGNFALSGSASDTNGLKQVVITQKIGDLEPVVIETLNAAGATTFNWSTNTGTGKGLPRNPTTNVASTGNALTSGIYTYTVTVTDVAGNESITEATTKTTTKTVKASIDKTAPVISITTPASNSSNTGLSAISDVSFRFAGTAGDSGEGATGVEKVWYKIVAQNAAVPSAPSSDTAVDDSWTDLGFSLASNTTSWFFTQSMNAGTTASDSEHISEGNYKLAVYAVDMAGNVSSAASQIFDVDMSAPEIVTVLDTTTLEESMTQTKTGTYTFKYKVTETYGLAADNPVLTMKKDNADFTGFTQSAADADGYVTVNITSQADGLYEYTIAATDKVVKNSTIRRNILLDTTPPALTVTSPDLSGYQNSTNVKVIGSAEDKTGTKAVWYAFGTASMPAVPANNTTADASWTGNSWTKATGTTSWSFTVTGVEGTDKNLYIAAVDENGAVTTSFKLSSSAADTVSSAIIKVDATNPTLTETGIGAGTQYKNAAFTLSGTASDTGSGLAATNPVTITDGTTTYTPAVTAGTGAWTQSITPASEGTYNYTITATDKAGRASTESRTIVYDTHAPTITTKQVGTVAAEKQTTVGTTKWYSITQIPVVIAGDDNLAGLSTIECSTDWDSTAQNADNGNWTTLNRSGSNSISCTEQGLNTIYIRATDQAGNKSNPADYTIEVNIDTTAPELAVTSYSYDGGTAAAVTDSVYVDGEKTLTVSGTYSDTGVGIDSLTFKIGNTTIAPTVTSSGNNWTTTFTPTAGGKLSINGKDKLNNAAQEVTPFTIVLDDTDPTISNISLNGAYKPSALAETYYTNNTNTEFKLTGVAADNTGVESVSVVINNAAGTQTAITPVLNADGSGSLNNWTFTLTDDTNKNAWKALATSATAVVTVTDKAKNVATQTVTINFDVEAPSAKHELDASTPNAKDLYFRIGNQNRDDGATTTNGVTTWTPTWSSTLDEDVGGKYSHGTFGNETSIEIRGRFDDYGSGVKNIYYKVYGTDQTGTALNTIKTDVLAAPDGIFSLKAEDTKRVFYKKSDGSRDNKNITTNFREKLIGFAEGENYLVLVAVDNVGNAAVDAVVVGGTTYPNYSINVDRTAPTLTSNTTETLYTNAASGATISLSGSVSDGDDGAGIGKVVIIDPTETTEIELPATVSENTWSYSLDANILSGASGTTSIYAKAYDKAGSGNWTKVEVARVVVDTTNPEISLDTPDDADNATGIQINGTIKLTGSASDKIGTTPNNNFEVTKIQYRMTKDASGNSVSEDWDDITTSLMSNFSIASSESFVVSGFDTTNLTDKATYEIKAVIEDAAGNEVESTPVTVIVDQDTDRPVITLSNLTLQSSGSSYLKSTKTLYLSVSDDDGVTLVRYKIDNAANWTQLTGSSITVDGDDGVHTIKFEVTDKKGTTFDSTSTTTTTPTPKITDGNGTNVVSGNLTLNIVTQKPAVSNIKYSVYDALKVLQGNQTDADRWSAWSDSLGTVSATRYTKFKIQLSASSAQGINSAAVTTTALNGATTAVNFTCADNSHNDADSHVWTSDEIGIVNSISNTAVNGIKEINLTVKDNVPDPMVYEQTLSINVDNISPTISISQPSNLIGQEETIRGDVAGENHVTLYYAVSRYCHMNNDGTPNESSVYEDSAVQPNSNTAARVESDVTLATKWTQLEQEDNGLKWYVYFDGKLADGSTTEYDTDHTAKLGTYLTESYLGITTADEIADTSNPYDSRTPVYFWIKAVDDYGNEAVEKQKLNIDPQGERPIVEISYPTNTVDAGGNLTSTPPTLGGTIRMTGTATDNNSAKYAWIQVDFDGTTGFSQAELTYLKNKGYTLGKISTNTKYTNAASVPTNLGTGANAAADYGIVVDVKGSGWNQTLNSASEFNQSELVAASIIQASTDGTSTLKITVYATDADTTPHKSLPATQTVIIDSNRPYVEQSSLELVQYGDTPNNGEYPIIARKPYSSGTRISGIWYLVGNIKDDDSGIGEIKHNNSVKITNTLDDNGISVTDTNDHNYWFKPVSATVTESGHIKTIYNYKFSIPLGSEETDVVGTSTSSFAIKELTTTGLEAEAEHSVTYDNKAPVLTTSDNALIRLERNVQNSNGFYSFGAIASEDDVDDVKQSGVERIAFYFTRDMNYNLYTKDHTIYSQHSQAANAQTHDLFDVMISHENTDDTTDVTSGNMIIDYNDETTSGLVLQKGLYWKSKIGAISGSTVTLTAADKNIHKKGLAMVNGTIYLINNLSANGTEITLDSAPGNAANATVLFAICNVIDNGGEKNRGAISTTSGYGFGYYPTRDNDDGDLITESFASQGTEWIFDASINSKNLPDGPITLHMVAFDKAGNYAEWASATSPASTETFTDKDFVVSNNAPRIAGMKIGTDENGNGTVDDDEFISTYSNKYELGYDPDTSEEMRDVTFPAQIANIALKAARIIKGRTVVKPELVGGNGKISYNYSVYSKANNTPTDHTFAETAEYEHEDSTEIATGTTNAVADLTAFIDLPVSEFIGTTDGEDTSAISDGLKKFVFKFGDSTPGKTANEVVTNNATLNVIMDVALRETNKAKNWILPFYWKSKTDNSLFDQSKDNGHI